MKTHLNDVKSLDHNRAPLGLATACLFFLLAAVPVNARQITGVPGSPPSATTPIDGRYIANPPPSFGGVINLGAKQSKPWWPRPFA